MSRHLVSILVVIAAALISARAKSLEVPSPEIGKWLDRAVTELPGLRRELETAKGPSALDRVTEKSVAIMIFRCRGSDADRARLVDLAAQTENTPPAGEAPVDRFRPFSIAADLYSIAGAKQDVHRLLPLMEKIDRETPDATSNVTTELIIRSRIGELPDGDLEWVRGADMSALLLQSADEGRPADFDRYEAVALRKLGQPTEKSAENYCNLASWLAVCGKVDEARKVAAAIPSTSWQHATAFSAIAREGNRRGDATAAAQDLREAVTSAAALRGVHRIITHGILLSDARSVGDPALIGEVADALRDDEQADTTAARPSVFFNTVIAISYATIGRRADYDRAVATAEKAVSLQRQDLQPSASIEVAAAYARGGDRAKAQAAAAQYTAIGRIHPMHRPALEQYALAYAHAGDFESAIDAVRTVLPDHRDRSKPLCQIALMQTALGQYTEAQRTVATIDDPFMKLIAHRGIVVARVKKGQMEGLADWIASHATARERAILYLAVAQQMLGIAGKGEARIFDMGSEPIFF